MNEYAPVGWVDYPRTDTPITAANLSQMEDGISNVTDEVIKIENGTTNAAVATKWTTGSAGSSSIPIYLNAGNPQACSPATTITSGYTGVVTGGAIYTALKGGTVSKVGTATVGGTAKPIYLSSGTPTACSGTVGSAKKPVYMNAGTITACSSTVGSSTAPVYMNSGTITACSGIMSGALLWTNSSTGSFSAQTITLSSAMTNYTYLKIFYYDPLNSIMSTDMMPTQYNTYGKTTLIFSYYDGLASSTFIGSRNVTGSSSTKLYFASGTYNNETNNYVCVPYKIFGIKIS